MQQLKDIKTIKNTKLRANEYHNWLVDNGYIYNEVTGLEKIEVLERFKLNPEMKTVPTQLYQDYEIKQQKITERDILGKKTGEKIVEQKIYKETYHIGASENFLAYFNWKKNKNLQDIAQAEQMNSLINSNLWLK